MKCAAIKNDGAPCTQGISTGCTILIRTDDGDFDYEVCRNHFNKYQRTLKLKLNHERRRKHNNVAVIGDTHIDLQSGVEITQERLPLDSSKENTVKQDTQSVTVFWIRSKEHNTMRYLAHENRDVESFASAIQELVAGDNPEGTIGYVIQWGSRVFKISLDGNTWTENQGGVVLKKAKDSTKTKVDNAKTYVCNNCSHWEKYTNEDGVEKSRRIQVTHGSLDEVRDCYTSKS